MVGVESKRIFFLFCAIAGLIFALNWPIFPCSIAQSKILPAGIAQSTGYKWQNVAIGGAGYVTGLVIHPTEPNLIYMRTDIGGAYRWDNSGQKWIPLMEMFGRQDNQLFGIESLALDSSNPNIIYVATGEYTDDRGKGQKGVILKSTNRGQSWSRSNLSIKFGSNEDWRWNGERLAVDPNQSKILYLGSRNDGLWKSTDGAVTWKNVSNFPSKGTSKRGIIFVIFDPRTGKSGSPTQTIYVGVAGAGVYRSEDGGKSWNLLAANDNLNPQRGALASDGTLYVTFDTPGAISKFKNNQWTNITPAQLTSFNAIAVASDNPNIIVASEWRYGKGNKIFRTTNGGQKWQEVQYAKEYSIPWWPDIWWANGISSIAIAPKNSQRVWYADGYGVWRTDDINRNPSMWRTYVAGHEEIVNFTMKSQPESGALLQGSADIGGLRHSNLNNYPDKQFQSPAWMANEFVSLDASEKNSNFVVAVSSRRWTSKGLPDPGYALFSTNDGKTWTEFPTYPLGFRKTVRGRVAVSATNDRHIVWAPEGEKNLPYYSKDRAKTWHLSKGAPSGTTTSVWQWHQPLTSDKVNGNKFYLYKEGRFYTSVDGGANWSVTITNFLNLDKNRNNQGLSVIKAAPGLEGEVWASFNEKGLYRSSNSAKSFTQIKNVQQAENFAFGKNAPGRNNPTAFVYGKVNNLEGIFRSDDMGQSWVKIDLPDLPIGKGALYMEGDRKIYGRVYIGTGGRGVYYGELQNTPVSASPNQKQSFLSCAVSQFSSLFR